MKNLTDIMTRGVRVLSPTDSVAKAAQTMDELGIGSIPVCNGEKLLGMVTDRDIALRAVACGRDSTTTTLGDIMTADVKFAFDDQSVDEVLHEMGSSQIRRLPVIDRGHKLVGIVSLGDIAKKRHDAEVAGSLSEISAAGATAH